MFNADSLVLLISSTLILSYVSGIFYSRTRIPDIVWLTIFGLVLGPVLNVYDKDLFLTLSPLMSTIALGIILFDAGYNIDPSDLLETMGKSLVLALIMFVAVVVVVGSSLTILMPEFSLIEAMLLATMIGGTSTIAVVSILDTLKKSGIEGGSAYPLLVMESVISDPICIVAAIMLIKVNLLGGLSPTVSFLNIFNSFVSSSFIGLAAGLAWAAILSRFRDKPYGYVTTLAILFPVYVVSEAISGSGGGPIAALVFGLALNNSKRIYGRLGLNVNITRNKGFIRLFHGEVTYFVKSFFFVYIGLIVNMTLNSVIVGIAISALVLGLRYVVADGVGRMARFTPVELSFSKVIFSQGLPAMIMSQLPIIYDPTHQFFSNPEIYVSISVPVVLITVLYGALAGPTLVRRLIQHQSG